jgi:hypothetical protein
MNLECLLREQYLIEDNFLTIHKLLESVAEEIDGFAKKKEFVLKLTAPPQPLHFHRKPSVNWPRTTKDMGIWHVLHK